MKGFWEKAAAVPDAPARPLIAFDWYRTFIQFLLDSGSYTWFAKLVTAGEILIGIALILGLFTGIAAFFGGFMNWNFMSARRNSMTIQHIQPGRHTARSLAGFVALALLVVVLAACTGVQPGVAQAPAAAATVAPTQTSPAAAGKPAAAPTQAPVALAPAGNLTQSAEAGAVTVEITPLNLSDLKANALDFKVTMNTHSVELGVDRAKLAVLKTGENEVAAKVWQAPAGGGHHVAGTLSFPGVTAAGKPVLEGATSVTVVIRNLAGVPEREFTWDLGKSSSATGTAATTAMPMSGTPAGNAVTSTQSSGGI